MNFRLITIFQWFCYLATLRFFWIVFEEIYKIYLRRPNNLRSLYKKWAIVTGCTDGIGKAYCLALAERGFNLVLLSRTEKKLDDFEEELKGKIKGVEIKKMAIDFSYFDDEKIKKLLDLLDPVRKDIGILVNNVGVSYNICEYYHRLSEQLKHNIIEVNINATRKMTEIILNLMLESKPEYSESRRGAIINISSGFSQVPSNLVTLYAATKSFIDKYSEGLHAEYKNRKIDIQAQHPYFVATKMSKIRKTNFFIPSPENYVKSALDTVGFDAIETPFLGHKIQRIISNFVPKFYLKSMHTKHCLSLRKRAIKLNKLKRRPSDDLY